MGGGPRGPSPLRDFLEIRLQVMPVLLGAGTHLFDNIGLRRIELEQTRLIGTPAVAYLHFRVVK